MQIDINLIKQLRDQTAAPLKDVKDALEQTGGDVAQAAELLKKKGVSQLAKKSDRDTNEGVVRVKKFDNKFVAIKLTCETDFVAKNDIFHDLSEKMLEVLSSESTVEAVEGISSETQERVNALLQDYIVKLGENMRLVDAYVVSGNGYGYEHPGNKIAALVLGEGDLTVAKEVALQVASMNPKYFTREDVPTEVIESLKKAASADLAASNKPADIIEKIVEGRVSKELSDDVLMMQAYIKDETKTMKNLVEGKFDIHSFKRFSI